MKLAWITGGGSGIGAELALLLAREGWRVAISGRGQEKLEAVASSMPGKIIPLPLDVTDASAVADTVARIEASLGPIDLAVLNAGDYEQMGANDFSVGLVRRLMDVNYFGVVNGVDALLPRMRTRGRGHIAIVASLAGYRGLPLAAAYGPTKAALINLAESLRLDCERAGIKLQVANPGFVATPLTARNSFAMPDLMQPIDAAKAFRDGLLSDRFEIMFPKRFALQMKLLRLLPYGLFFRILRRVTGA